MSVCLTYPCRRTAAGCPVCDSPPVLQPVPHPAPPYPLYHTVMPVEAPRGCICPPTAEQTCQGAVCPRRAPVTTTEPRASVSHLDKLVMSQGDLPDWPPVGSAIGRPDGHQQRGSTGQLFEVRGGQWHRVMEDRPQEEVRAPDRVEFDPPFPTGAQIKHMVDRFLMWKFPKTMSPDNGIAWDKTRDAVGTNLLSASEAAVMVLHMVEGMTHEPAVEIAVSSETYQEVRRLLIERGTGGTILEIPRPRRIHMTGVTIVDSAEPRPAPMEK